LIADENTTDFYNGSAVLAFTGSVVYHTAESGYFLTPLPSNLYREIIMYRL